MRVGTDEGFSVRSDDATNARSAYQRPARRARLTRHVQRRTRKLVGRRMAYGVAFGVVGNAIAVVTVRRTLPIRELSTRARAFCEATGHTCRSPVVSGAPDFVGRVDEHSAHLRPRAVGSCGCPPGPSEKVRVPTRTARVVHVSPNRKAPRSPRGLLRSLGLPLVSVSACVDQINATVRAVGARYDALLAPLLLRDSHVTGATATLHNRRFHDSPSLCLQGNHSLLLRVGTSVNARLRATRSTRLAARQ